MSLYVFIIMTPVLTAYYRVIITKRISYKKNIYLDTFCYIPANDVFGENVDTSYLSA